MPKVQEAIDPIAFFVLAIIVFNVISSIVKGLRNAAARAQKPADVQAQQRMAPAAPQTQAQDGAAARRAAEITRLRKALLASAGLSDTDTDTDTGQTVTYTVSSQPQTQAQAPSVRVSLPRARASQPVATPPAMPAAPSAVLAPPPDTWSLESPGSLMTLESAATAFQRLATAGTSAAALQSSAALAATKLQPLAILQGPTSGANLFIAAAIVGPCAAFRPIGHTPGGW